MLHYTPPKRAPLPDDFDEFYASLTPKEKELHLLALEKLGSSYFVQWTHFYKKWKKAQINVIKLFFCKISESGIGIT